MIVKAHNIPSYTGGPTYLREDSLWVCIMYPGYNWKIGGASGFIFKYDGYWYMHSQAAFSLRTKNSSNDKFVPTFMQINNKEVYIRKLNDYPTHWLCYLNGKYVITDSPPIEELHFENYRGWYESPTITGTYIGRNRYSGSTWDVELHEEEYLSAYKSSTFAGLYISQKNPSTKTYVGVRQMKGSNGLVFTQTDDVSFSNLIQPYKTYFYASNFNYIENRVYRGSAFQVSNILTLTNSGGATIRVDSIYPRLYTTTLGAIKTFTILNKGSGNYVGKEVYYSQDVRFIVTDVDEFGGVLNLVFKIDGGIGGWECYSQLPYEPDSAPVTFTRYYIGSEPDPTPYDITVSFDKLIDFSSGDFYIAQVPVLYDGDRV